MADISMLKALSFEIWTTGLGIGLKIVLSVFMAVILIQLVWLAYRYVTDMSRDEHKSCRKLFFGDVRKFMPYDLPYSTLDEDDLGEGCEALVVYAFFGVVASAIWPAVVVYSAIHGLLFLTRSMIRFKKKVYKALENKADKDHKH